jgi:hypothetical protein
MWQSAAEDFSPSARFVARSRRHFLRDSLNVGMKRSELIGTNNDFDAAIDLLFLYGS